MKNHVNVPSLRLLGFCCYCSCSLSNNTSADLGSILFKNQLQVSLFPISALQRTHCQTWRQTVRRAVNPLVGLPNSWVLMENVSPAIFLPRQLLVWQDNHFPSGEALISHEHVGRQRCETGDAVDVGRLWIKDMNSVRSRWRLHSCSYFIFLLHFDSRTEGLCSEKPLFPDIKRIKFQAQSPGWYTDTGVLI